MSDRGGTVDTEVSPRRSCGCGPCDNPHCLCCHPQYETKATLPDKSRILEVAEAIGDTTLAPSIGDAERAKKWLLLLGDECYRQRDEIERLKTENERLMRCCGKDEMRTDIDCLRAENAELRGIIRGEREIAEGKTVTYEV